MNELKHRIASAWIVVHTIGWVGVALVFITGATLALERPWLRYPRMPAPVLRNALHAGETVLLSITRCNDTKERQIYSRAALLVRLDAHQAPIVLPSGLTLIEPGCSTITSAVNSLPAYTPPGRYRIDGLSKADGAIRNFTVPWGSEPFEVVAP